MIEIRQEEIDEVRNLNTHIEFRDFSDADKYELMEALLLRLERAEAAVKEERETYMRMHKDNSYLTVRVAELDKYREDAAELLREIRDGEVNPEDEADKFLRDDTRSELSKARIRIAELEEAMGQQSAAVKELETSIRKTAEITAWEAVKREVKFINDELNVERSTNELLTKRIAELEAALTRIKELDPEVDSDQGFNEWGEAHCFKIAQDVAKEALEAQLKESGNG